MTCSYSFVAMINFFLRLFALDEGFAFIQFEHIFEDLPSHGSKIF